MQMFLHQVEGGGEVSEDMKNFAFFVVLAVPARTYRSVRARSVLITAALKRKLRGYARMKDIFSTSFFQSEVPPMSFGCLIRIVNA